MLLSLAHEILALIEAIDFFTFANGAQGRLDQASNCPILMLYLFLIGDKFDNILLLQHQLDLPEQPIDLLYRPVDFVVQNVEQLLHLHLFVNMYSSL